MDVVLHLCDFSHVGTAVARCRATWMLTPTRPASQKGSAPIHSAGPPPPLTPAS